MTGVSRKPQAVLSQIDPSWCSQRAHFKTHHLCSEWPTTTWASSGPCRATWTRSSWDPGVRPGPRARASCCATRARQRRCSCAASRRSARTSCSMSTSGARRARCRRPTRCGRCWGAQRCRRSCARWARRCGVLRPRGDASEAVAPWRAPHAHVASFALCPGHSFLGGPGKYEIRKRRAKWEYVFSPTRPRRRLRFVCCSVAED